MLPVIECLWYPVIDLKLNKQINKITCQQASAGEVCGLSGGKEDAIQIIIKNTSYPLSDSYTNVSCLHTYIYTWKNNLNLLYIKDWMSLLWDSVCYLRLKYFGGRGAVIRYPLLFFQSDQREGGGGALLAPHNFHIRESTFPHCCQMEGGGWRQCGKVNRFVCVKMVISLSKYVYEHFICCK